MSAKRQKRIKNMMGEIEAAEDKAAQSLVDVADEQLFTVDRAGSKTAKRKISKEIALIDTHATLSRTEQILAKKAQEGEKKTPYAKITRDVEVMRDLWDEAPVAKKHTTSSSKNVVRERVALPGQSYNPSKTDHDAVLRQAVAYETKKAELEAHRAAQYQQVVPVVDNFNVNDDSESENDDEEEEEEEGGEEGPSFGKLSRRKKVKMTRAQRNKIKARNEAEFEKAKEKTEVDILKSIDTIPTILKSLAKEERAQAKNRKDLAQAKEATKKEALVAKLTEEEVGQVALSDELSGSLRTMIPKVVAVVDQSNYMRTSGDLMRRDRRKRRAYEKPHGDKNVVWIPKYKATTR